MARVDYCFACQKPLFKVTIGRAIGLMLEKALVCINEDCPRVGLLAVAGLRYKKKEEKNAVPSKSSHQPNRKKG